MIYPGIVYDDPREEALWYYMQARLFQSTHMSVVDFSQVYWPTADLAHDNNREKGPFSLFMTKYFDGMAWFSLMLHVNKQTELCAGKGPFDNIGALREIVGLLVFTDYYKYLMERIFQLLNDLDDNQEQKPSNINLDQAFHVTYVKFVFR